MKKSILAVSGLALALTLSACGKQEEAPVDTASAVASDVASDTASDAASMAPASDAASEAAE
ncbi:hypothetical protein [Tsuneonella suprasediminis]|uniref:Lipoprotein n=1 Tax=Tsuneonella suprasediminis TaxID=2306996 RepID=A0A419QZ16_9SPHN|nr:hypothetical protein [Tsuneonella suprasediminis]RJX66073.1 hypothetical protein D6858_14010 [Tsuneonella suprasediminis]UBS32716.1 hypothetical protein LBX01_14815 [Altererythrobacter sp. N1]